MANTCMDCGKSISKKAKRCQSCNAGYVARLPKVRKARSRARNADWANPEYRQKMGQPRPKQATTMLNLWKDGTYGTPEHLRNLSEGVKAACQRPEVIDRKSEAATLSWKDPAVWKKHSESMKAAHERGDHDNSEAMVAAWARGSFDGVFTEEVRQKQAEAIRAGIKASPDWVEKHTFFGEDNPNWQGGIALEPYGPEFTEELKLEIRVRDGFRCLVCGTPENGAAHDVHHCDYDKKNNDPDNLVTLCKRHHTKTNFNRGYWQAYFTGQGYELMLGAC